MKLEGFVWKCGSRTGKIEEGVKHVQNVPTNEARKLRLKTILGSYGLG